MSKLVDFIKNSIVTSTVTATRNPDGSIAGLMAGGEVVHSVQVPSGIVAIGDSRTQYAERTAKTASFTMSGVKAVGVIDYCQSATGSLQYDADHGFRFSSSGTTQYGEYVPIKLGFIFVPDSTSVRLKIGVTEIPVAAEVAVTIGGSAISGYGSRGIAAWAARYLNHVLPTEVLGIGGATIGQIGDVIDNVIADIDSPKTKLCIFLAGTNNISNITDAGDISGIITECNEIWTKCLNNFKALIIIEETARFQAGTSSALSAVPQTLLRAINSAAVEFQRSNKNRVRFVKTLDWMCDPAQTTFQPRTNVIDNDGVHPAQLTCQVIGERVSAAIQSFGFPLPLVDWAAVGGNFDGEMTTYSGSIGNQVGTGGTVATGFTGSLSTGWTSVQQSGSDALVLSKVARTDIPGSYWQQASAASVTGANQWDVKTVAVDISTLGLAVGDTVQFAHEMAIDTSNLLGPVESTWRFVQPNYYAQTTYADGTVKLTGTHDVLWYVTPAVVIPTGTTTIEFRLRIDVSTGGDLQVRVGRLSYRKL